MSSPIVVNVAGLSAGVTSNNSDGGEGVNGFSNTGIGVHGINGQGSDPDGPGGPGKGAPVNGCGVFGESLLSEGVVGSSASQHGVYGSNGAGSGVTPGFGCGVWGDSNQGYGVFATSATQNGVFGTSKGNDGIHGETTSQTHVGVSGLNNSAWPCTAISGTSTNGHGTRGTNGAGSGKSPNAGCGIWGDSNQGYGVYGTSKSGNAGGFDGNVTVTGTLTANDVMLSGMDCAEEFDVATPAALEPGTVVVFNGEESISPSTEPYSKRVAGVISGAARYRPGIVLGRSHSSGEGKAPVALVGRVYCKVDADYSPIAVGDLLTTSSTPGHAMKAADPLKGFGSVVGKALRPLESGQGLLPILVALQ
jgi:hypothetical protein